MRRVRGPGLQPRRGSVGPVPSPGGPRYFLGSGVLRLSLPESLLRRYAARLPPPLPPTAGAVGYLLALLRSFGRFSKADSPHTHNGASVLIRLVDKRGQTQRHSATELQTRWSAGLQPALDAPRAKPVENRRSNSLKNIFAERDEVGRWHYRGIAQRSYKQGGAPGYNRLGARVVPSRLETGAPLWLWLGRAMPGRWFRTE